MTTTYSERVMIVRSQIDRLDTLCAGIVTSGGVEDACCKPATTILYDAESADVWPACTWHAGHPEHAAAMSKVDGCPECVLNTEPPRSAVAVGNGWRCAYLCSDCGHAWTTDWAAESAQLCGKRVITTAQFEGGLWDNRDAPAGCVNTAARADRILSGRTG